MTDLTTTLLLVRHGQARAEDRASPECGDIYSTALYPIPACETNPSRQHPAPAP